MFFCRRSEKEASCARASSGKFSGRPENQSEGENAKQRRYFLRESLGCMCEIRVRGATSSAGHASNTRVQSIIFHVLEMISYKISSRSKKRTKKKKKRGKQQRVITLSTISKARKKAKKNYLWVARDLPAERVNLSERAS